MTNPLTTADASLEYCNECDTHVRIAPRLIFRQLSDVELVREVAADAPRVRDALAALERAGRVSTNTLAIEVGPIPGPPHAAHRALPFIGSYRRFGPDGPVYQVLAYENEDGEAATYVRIRVTESDEEIAYPVASAMGDPEAE